MAKGIVSPWAKEEAPKEIESPFIETTYNVNTIFEGRAFKIIVSTPVKFKDEGKDIVLERAKAILGEVIKSFLTNNKFKGLLASQQIFIEDVPIVNKITLPLGAINLFCAASSGDWKVAKAMCIDRLVLAIREFTKTDKDAKEALQKVKVMTVNVQ